MRNARRRVLRSLAVAEAPAAFDEAKVTFVKASPDASNLDAA